MKSFLKNIIITGSKKKQIKWETIQEYHGQTTQ